MTHPTESTESLEETKINELMFLKLSAVEIKTRVYELLSSQKQRMVREIEKNNKGGKKVIIIDASVLAKITAL